MANFEGLIRGALLARGETTPEIRSQVYQSSRNALQRLIEGNRDLTVEAVVRQQKSLEEAIACIEREFVKPDPAPSVNHAALVNVEAADETPVPSDDPGLPQPADPKPVENSDPFYELQQVLGTNLSLSPEPVVDEKQVSEKTADERASGAEEIATPATEPSNTSTINTDTGSDASDIAQQTDRRDQVDNHHSDTIEVRQTIPPAFTKRRRMQKTLFWVFLTFVVLSLVIWFAYRALIGVLDGSSLGQVPGNGTPFAETSIQRDAASEYINIVEPGDLTAMVASDRGRIEIINEQNLEVIRLLSVRDDVDRNQSAKPILLRLKPGVIQQVRGKRVTVELFARSGSSTPAQFAVECIFDSQIGCGRKRFRVGVQPEASVFAFTMSANTDINSDAFIAISTDITDDAAITGKGDVLDIGYVRLRTLKE